MADASSSSMDFDVVVDLHTTAAAAQSLMNENSSNSSDAGLNIKIPVMYTSSSDTETDDYRIQRRLPALGSLGGSGSSVTATATTSTNVEIVRSSSPPPNCAICLGRCKNKCFTDSCVHQFCFKCLCEWSKVKAECPLCKQAFRSIIHNVKAIDQYEEYLVQQPVVQIPHSPLEVTYQGALNSNFVVNGRRFYNFSMRSWPAQSVHNGVMASRSGPITIRNFMPEEELNGNSIPSASVAVNAAVESLPMRRNELLNLYRQELPEEISSTMSLGQLWRRYIYDRKLYALPVSDITGRYRESSARFYRNNPGQRIRLIPFANRDIICLLRNTNHDVSTVLESLNEGLEMSNILSRSFRRRLQPFLGERTAHFIHELNNFARSPYDMVGYDRVVQYAPQATDDEHVIEFSSSSDEETNNTTTNTPNTNTSEQQTENPSSTNNTINLTTNESTTARRTARRNAQASSTTTRTRSNAGGTSEFRVQSRSSVQNGTNSPMSLLSFTITTTSEGSETPGLSVAVSAGSRGHSQVAAINLSTHNRAHNELVIDLDDTVELNASTSGADAPNAPNNTNPANNNNNNINNNINININNNETSLPPPTTTTAPNPVPEGSPQIVASIALSTSSSDECEFVLERKPPHLRTPEMVSLNSESDSDVVFVDELKPILAEATYSTSENDEQASLSRLIDKQQQQQQQQQQQEQQKQEEQQEEQQPSTSTGLRSRSFRQVVTAKKLSADIQKQQDGTPVKRRRLRTRRLPTATLQCTDGSTSESNDHDDDDQNDSEYNGKRRTRSRAVGRKRTTRSRKMTSTRRIARKRTGKVNNNKNEKSSIKEPVQDSDGTLTNHHQPQRKKRRISTKRNSHVSQNSRNSQSSIKAKQTSSSSSLSDEESSSTEEDEKVNLKALQLRLKKSLSDIEVEDNVKQEVFDYTQECPTYIPTRNDEMSVERNNSTANSIHSSKNKNKNKNKNTRNSENKNKDEEYSPLHQPYIPKRKDYEQMSKYKSNDDADSNSMQDGPSCSKLALLRSAAKFNKDRLAKATTTSTSTEMPTTSAAAAAAVAVASISNLYEKECNASFDVSNNSAAESETQKAQKKTHALYQRNSMSDASMSPGSIEPYVPQCIEKSATSADFYDSNSTSSIASNSSQLFASTSRQADEPSNSPTIDMEATSDGHANNSDSSNSSTSSPSPSPSSSSGSDSDEDGNNDEHPLA